MARRILHAILSAFLRAWDAVTHPVSQIVLFAVLSTYGATMHGGPALVVSAWVAAAFGAIGVATLRSPCYREERRLHTGTSYAALTANQLVMLAGVLPQFTRGGWLVAMAAVMALAFGWDAFDRIRFHLRVRHAGGPVQEARRFTEGLEGLDSHDVHQALAREQVTRRFDSRTHWRYAEALSAQNVALYEAEAADGE